MKLYIAGHNQQEANAVASLCREAGHEITSRWLDKPFNPTEQHTEAERRQIAYEDTADVTAADALVLCASPRRVPGGKFVEAGIALGQMKYVYVLGHRENMLLWHPRVQQFNSVEDFLTTTATNQR